MEEILHHLGCKNLCKERDILPLVQEFSHQQYVSPIFPNSRLEQ